MKIDRSIPGSYEPTPYGYSVYLPFSLPPESLTLGRDLSRLAEQVTHHLGQVNMSKTLLRNVSLLTYRSLQQEAIASSTIENTIASPDELVRYQLSNQTERSATVEVANYGKALEWGLKQLPALPISTRLILGLHKRLLAGSRGAHYAGRYKEQQNAIGRQGDSFANASFVPPPPGRVGSLIGDLEQYINYPDNNEPRVVQCALAHYQFETIHPFADGNGRVGRLLIILQLIQLGLLSGPYIYPSGYFERNRDRYCELLNSVSTQGAWREWIAFFLQGLLEQCDDTIAFVDTILELKEHVRSSFGNVSARGSVKELLDAFFEEPFWTITKLSQRCGMAYGSAQSALRRLEEQRLVFEVTGRRKGRVYGCRPVLDAMFTGSSWKQLDSRSEE